MLHTANMTNMKYVLVSGGKFEPDPFRVSETDWPQVSSGKL